MSAALLPNAINQVIFGPVQKLARRPFAGSDHPSDRHFPQLKTPFPRFPPRAALRQLPTAAGPGPAPRRHLPPSENPDPPCSPYGAIPQAPHRVPAAAPRREGRRWEKKPTRRGEGGGGSGAAGPPLTARGPSKAPPPAPSAGPRAAGAPPHSATAPGLFQVLCATEKTDQNGSRTPN